MGKKISYLVGVILVMTFAFWGTEYLLYTLLIKESKLFLLCFILFLLMVSLLIGIVNKFDLPGKIAAPVIVLSAVLVSLGILKATLSFLYKKNTQQNNKMNPHTRRYSKGA